MRHVYVVIDCSRSMEDQDLKPNRLTSTLKVKQSCLPGHQQLQCDCLLTISSHLFFPPQLMEVFVDEYFDQNPISQVCHKSYSAPCHCIQTHTGFILLLRCPIQLVSF